MPWAGVDGDGRRLEVLRLGGHDVAHKSLRIAVVEREPRTLNLDQHRMSGLEDVIHIVQRKLVFADRTGLQRRGLLEAVEIPPAEDFRVGHQLIAKYSSLTAESTAMRCVGYRQALEHLSGEYDVAELRDRGIFATRQLAKRQLTWLRSMKDIVELDCLETDLNELVFNEINQYIKSVI